MESKIEDCHGNRVYTVLDKSGYSACETLKQFLDKVGKPECAQSDNGVEFTNRYISELHPKRKKASSLSGFEMILKEKQVKHSLIKPRTPAHNGKVERFHETLLRDLASFCKKYRTRRRKSGKN